MFAGVAFSSPRPPLPSFTTLNTCAHINFSVEIVETEEARSEHSYKLIKSIPVKSSSYSVQRPGLQHESRECDSHAFEVNHQITNKNVRNSKLFSKQRAEILQSLSLYDCPGVNVCTICEADKREMTFTTEE